MTPSKLIKRLLFIPKCASCGERLKPIGEKTSLTYGKLCLCESCHNKWRAAKATPCPHCGKTVDECLCHSEFFKKDQPNIPTVIFYNSSSQSVESRVVFTAKRVNDNELFEFLALELLSSLTKTLFAMGIDGEDCIFTWIPRKRSSIAKYGFDQGQRLCEEVAKGFGKSACPLFLKVGGREQKNLQSSERRKNVEGSIKLNLNASHFPKSFNVKDLKDFLNNKTVILIDDVMTTGSTLEKGASLLKSIGAERVIAACVAKTAAKTAKDQKHK